MAGCPCTVVQDGEIVATSETDTVVTVKRGQKPLHVAHGERVTEYEPEITAAGWMDIIFIDFGVSGSLNGALWGYSEVTE